MPEYNIVIDNRAYKVELSKKEGKGQFEASVNDKSVNLKIEESEKSAPSLLILEVAGKTYRAELERIDRRAPFTLKVNDALFQVQLKEPIKKAVAPTPIVSVVARSERGRGTDVQEGSVVAPMAGKIVSIRVKKGDAVKVGDVVCILEAMKMENEITVAKDGTVHEVNVAEGTPVNEGDVLVVVK